MTARLHSRKVSGRRLVVRSRWRSYREAYEAGRSTGFVDGVRAYLGRGGAHQGRHLHVVRDDHE